MTARDCRSGGTVTFTCKRLILAAGTLNTAKIVLKSNDDHATALPLLDTNLLYMPLVDPWSSVGARDARLYSAAMLSPARDSIAGGTGGRA